MTLPTYARRVRHSVIFGVVLSTLPFILPRSAEAQLPAYCERDVTANVVALDQPVLFNRLGASNVNGMIFALERDVMNKTSGLTLNRFGAATPGDVTLRPDKRPRPLVLRIRVGDCLSIKLTNLLSPVPNPIKPAVPDGDPLPGNDQFNVPIDEQVTERRVSIHVSGLQHVNGPDQDDGSFVGENADSTIAQGASNAGAEYTLFAANEGVFNLRGLAATLGSDGNQGNAANLLHGQVIVEPAGAKIYRSTVTDEELRLALDLDSPNSTFFNPGYTGTGHPIIDYEALYPPSSFFVPSVWGDEGKDSLPVLNMLCNAAAAALGACVLNEILHSAIDAVIVGDQPDGSFSAATYPLENAGYRNPTLPNRLEPFRDFASVWHGENSAAQAFPKFYDDEGTATGGTYKHVMAGVTDTFMINYGSGGIGSEIVANRLLVGPMHDCLSCAFEEFFLTSFTVGDPAQLVDVAANTLIENIEPADIAGIKAGTATAIIANLGPKATYVPYPDDPANVHHSYTGDFVKFRNTHIGQEQHVFHLHNHQWLFNPNDDNSNYIDAQGIGPGSAYTYEINLGGSGNRNKTAGDAIFHCHFYPHFAQGMWYLWRNHDVLETGTPLDVTMQSLSPTGFHTVPWALENGTPMLATDAGLIPEVPGARVRALPDGEVVAGAPIPAIIPLPGLAMPPLPEEVQTVPNPLKTTASLAHPDSPGALVPVGSLARVAGGRDQNPGFPFWIAGIEDVVGQRPPTPPLDMISEAETQALVDTGADLWQDLVPAQADGWHGGVPRAALRGIKTLDTDGVTTESGGVAISVETRLDFSKVILSTQGVFYPEEGTDVEQVAMAFHAIREHPSCLPDGTCDASFGGTGDVDFVVNGLRPAIGAPFHEPCIDDAGARLGDGVTGAFFSGGSATGPAPTGFSGSSPFNADSPRIYKGVNIQFDAVLNKVGYHYPQQRIIALWEDSSAIITKAQAPEPMVLRFNTFDCGVYHHANVVPEFYEMDDYQVRTPTDIIGQHIHLPKWDLTTADGAANGWNYEDGTLAPGAVQERVAALNCFSGLGACPAGVAGGIDSHQAGTGSGLLADLITPAVPFAAVSHPYWAAEAAGLGAMFEKQWTGTRVTQQRWFFDPVVNIDNTDRGLGIIFTHDHYGPSTHQQVGLYATVLTEPAGSEWRHNETGVVLGDTAPGVNPAGRIDGGPTSWQAAIIPPFGSGDAPFREFYFEYSDFQHAYEAGVYVGADQQGLPLGTIAPGVETPMFIENTGNPAFSGAPADAFRFAINPPFRLQIDKVPGSVLANPFPDIIVDAAGFAGTGCPTRPCPQAIDVEDPGLFAVNYRNEPIGLRIYDPNRLDCPGGDPGCQAVSEDVIVANGILDPGEDTNGNGVLDGDDDRGDLAYAFQSRVDRAINDLNSQPAPGPGGAIFGTEFPPPLNASDMEPGDPYTPMMRVFAGDLVRVRQQAGGDEETHYATVHGLKWLQGGSSYGKSGNSGWRNAQSGAISEQFTLSAPVIEVLLGNNNSADLLYSMDTSADGYWSGIWGLMRTYAFGRTDLHALPTTIVAPEFANAAEFDSACPIDAPVRRYDVTAMLAGEALPDNPDVGDLFLGNIQDPHPTDHMGASPDPAGGTLVYNSRRGPLVQGPIHDPTAMVYLHTSDLVPVDPLDPACFTASIFDPTSMTCAVRLADDAPIEPLILRAAAGDCMKVTLRNRLPAESTDVPELASFNTILGVVKRDRLRASGSTTFQPNLFLASNTVGLHPQLVAYDTQVADGTLVGRGNNPLDTLVGPGEAREVTWYAGHLSASGSFFTNLELMATPVEFGVANLQPADKIKQGQKSLLGQLIIEPLDSTWTEDVSMTLDAQGIPSFTPDGTRTQATVCPGGASIFFFFFCPEDFAGSFRDFSSVWSKGLTHYYANSEAVEHMNGEGFEMPEDSQGGTGSAMNYRIEPTWFRLGIKPNALFGHDGSPPTTFGAQTQFDVYSNTKIGGGMGGMGMGSDPETPVYHVYEDQPFRVRVSMPHGTNRASTVELHGFSWQRDPYVCPGVDDNGIVGRCKSVTDGADPTTVGSTAIGDNVQGMTMSGEEGIFPATHFDLVLPNSNGQAPGDYMLRDASAGGYGSGLWGIVRVLPGMGGMGMGMGP